MSTARKNRQSIIEVTVVDLKPLLEETYETMKADGQLDEGVTSLDVYGERFGYVRTSEGIFFLSDECCPAVTTEHPLTETSSGLVPLYFQYDESFSMAPNATIEVDANDVLDLPVLGHKNLSDFVRTFGHRLEQNFHNWNEFLTPIYIPQGEN